VPTGGYTLMGSPTVVADITSPGSDSQIAARLLDVDPGTNTQTLVARGLWRPAITNTPQTQVFQLHPNGYRFADGHVAKLELLPKDSGTVAGNSYGRTSNNQANVTLENLELRLPVLEAPDSLDGLVEDPVTKFVPPGYTMAPGYPPTGYPRPKGASPLRVPLVPAYKQCVSPSRTHGPPLAFPSCSPQQESNVLTVGTPDANGRAARSIGFARFTVLSGNPATPADEADVGVQVSITDVRRSSDLEDYTGELTLQSQFRWTDRDNAVGPGGGGNNPATVVDLPFPIVTPCSPTVDPGVGSTCSITTTFDAVIATPTAVKEGKRSIWGMGQVFVEDGGPDGVAATTPNTLFARQGVFAP
jgi:hypothetical protein